MTATISIYKHLNLPSLDLEDNYKQRQYLSQCLSQILADAYTLYLKTKNCYWNTSKAIYPRFHRISALQSRRLNKVVDAIARCIHNLGYEVPGSHKEFISLSSIPELNIKNISHTEQIVEELIEGNKILSRNSHLIQLRAESFHEDSTVELLMKHREIYEQNRWILHSLLEN